MADAKTNKNQQVQLEKLEEALRSGDLRTINLMRVAVKIEAAKSAEKSSDK
jgi:hypothetical protein